VPIFPYSCIVLFGVRNYITKDVVPYLHHRRNRNQRRFSDVCVIGCRQLSWQQQLILVDKMSSSDTLLPIVLFTVWYRPTRPGLQRTSTPSVPQRQARYNNCIQISLSNIARQFTRQGRPLADVQDDRTVFPHFVLYCSPRYNNNNNNNIYMHYTASLTAMTSMTFVSNKSTVCGTHVLTDTAISIIILAFV